MKLLYWLLIAHTGIWAMSAIITNLFNSESWTNTTLEDKFKGYLKAELQLFNALVTIWAVRGRLFKIWSKKWRERKQG